MKVLLNLMFCMVSSLNIFAQENIPIITPDDDGVDQKIYAHPDKAAEFPGGEDAMFDYFSRKSQYSVSKQGVKVYFQIVIDESGKISDYKLLKGANPKLDAEAKRLILEMPNWTPGYIQGKPVKSMVNLSITYSAE